MTAAVPPKHGPGEPAKRKRFRKLVRFTLWDALTKRHRRAKEVPGLEQQAARLRILGAEIRALAKRSQGRRCAARPDRPPGARRLRSVDPEATSEIVFRNKEDEYLTSPQTPHGQIY